MTDSGRDARGYAYRLLSYRGRSEQELREKLIRKGFPPDIAEATLAHLKKNGYLDDPSLAEHLKREALEKKFLGFRGAHSFMLQRGLSRELVDSTLGYDEATELRNAQKLVDKKLRSVENYLSEGDRRKLWNMLSRRGFSFTVIQKTLKNIRFEEETEI